MPKGKRRRRHKDRLSDDFSGVSDFSPTVCHRHLTHHARCGNTFVCFCLAQHPVGSYVFELHCYVVEAFHSTSFLILHFFNVWRVMLRVCLQTAKLIHGDSITSIFEPVQTDALPVQTLHIQANTCDRDRSNKFHGRSPACLQAQDVSLVVHSK